MYGISNSLDICRLLETRSGFFDGDAPVAALSETSLDEQILADPTARASLLTSHLKARFEDAVNGVLLDAFYHPEEYDITVSDEWDAQENAVSLTRSFSEAGFEKFRATALKAVHYLCNGEQSYLGALRAYKDQIAQEQSRRLMEDQVEDQDRDQNGNRDFGLEDEDVGAIFPPDVWISEEALETQLIDEAIEGAFSGNTLHFRMP